MLNFSPDLGITKVIETDLLEQELNSQQFSTEHDKNGIILSIHFELNEHEIKTFKLES